jgi:carboxyl-terminal processing protease
VDWPSALELYVRKNGKWWLAASLPKRIEIGNHISSSLHRTPQQTAATEQLIHGRICGLGVQINATPEGLLIEKVVPGSGAELARLKSGEIIARIDGQATSGMGVSQAANLLLGEEGTRVKLRVRDGRGRERSVTVTRRAFDLSDVEHRMLPDNIGLLRISRFTGLTGEHTQAALEELMSQGMGALILDLRGNTGGVYDQIVRVADLLIDKSRTMWFTKSVKGGRAKPVKASMASMVKLPVVVLVNDETAGAELIAAAIARNHRGRIVGQTTSGLTEAKSRVVNPDGSSELVVQGRFLISPRRLITGRGITPDVPMPPSASEEEVLSKAIELLD